MSYLILKVYYKQIKLKKKIYNLNFIILSNLILGYLTKKGKKGISFNFYINFLIFLKKKNTEKPLMELYKYINKIKPSILLYNKRKGTLIYELPRLLTEEKSIKKSIEWLIKLNKKRKKKMLDMLILELQNIKKNAGEVLKKKETIILKAEENRPFFYLLKKKR